MKLWLIKAKADFTGYIMNQNLVVRAETAREARLIAVESDRNDSWKSEGYATCDELLTEGEAGAIVVDNNGG